jgi:hypothetical protein
VLAAMAATGANLTYGIWIRRAVRDPKVLPFVLSHISLIGRRVANPCYGVLLATSLMMAITLSMPLTTLCLLTAIVLYVLAAPLGTLAHAAVARQQRRILENEGFDSPPYKDMAQKSSWLGAIVPIDVLIIAFLTVVKPGIWG